MRTAADPKRTQTLLELAALDAAVMLKRRKQLLRTRTIEGARMGHRLAHRNAAGNISAFARDFIEARLAGFEKDLTICLTPTPSLTRRGNTHAYFPALGACFGFLEYVTGLFRGNINGIGWRQIADWTDRFLPQPDYGRDMVRVFFDAFRHSVAHRGIATGIWIDRSTAPRARVTWRVLADARRPACRLVAEAGVLKSDPPWPCPYTHRMHIHLRALRTDLRKGVLSYAGAIGTEPHLQRNFETCMRQLYPLG